jgi:hypothetical protein
MEVNEKLENKLRKFFLKQGMKLNKSRVKNTHLNNQGGYMITDIKSNSVVQGVNYELTLEDVNTFMKDYLDNKLKSQLDDYNKLRSKS